jgi:hypothetical protein
MLQAKGCPVYGSLEPDLGPCLPKLPKEKTIGKKFSSYYFTSNIKLTCFTSKDEDKFFFLNKNSEKMLLELYAFLG